MFFSKIGGFVTLGLQILMVVAAILLFSYFDPFKIFAPAKPTLEDTPVSLRSIREIGQLISAEYYGEVLVSLREAQLEDIKASSLAFAEKAMNLNDRFIQSIVAWREEGKKFSWPSRENKIKNDFDTTFPSVVNDPEYITLINVLLEKNNLKREKDLLQKIFDNKIAKDTSELRVDTISFKRVQEKILNEEYADQVTRKKQLVIIGRGWVKAGFDFGTFNERNFHYDADKSTIHFFGLQPVILSKTINPWFIPEKGVKGFEILIDKGRTTPVDVGVVKRQALEMLTKQAFDRNILAEAKRNAEENLRHFFSLLLDKEIKEVIFHTNELNYYYRAIAENDTISAEELVLIDSLIAKHFPSDSLGVIAFIDSLSHLPVRFLDIQTSLKKARFAALAHTIASDGIFSSGDLFLYHKALSTSKTILPIDRVWYALPQDSINNIIKAGTKRESNSFLENIQAYIQTKRYSANANLALKDTVILKAIERDMTKHKIDDFQEFHNILVTHLDTNFTNYDLSINHPN